MGEWKTQLSLRVRQELRTEMEQFAKREKRKLGSLADILLEWSFEQLKTAGSIDRLLKRSTTERDSVGVKQDGS